MKLELDNNPNNLSISYVGANKIRVNQSEHTLPIALSPKKVLNISIARSFDQMQEQDWLSLLDVQSAIILCGTGSKIKFLPIELEEQLNKSGSSIDLMTTQAACRTFTLLSNDDREVIAILFGDENI